MNRTAALVAALVVVLATVVAGVAAAAPDGSAGAAQVASPDPANESAEAPAPGARLSGVVSVGSAEVDAEVRTRAFGIRLGRADSNASRAAVVADELDDLRERMATLRERTRTLRRARENGTISRARYEAEMVAVAARSASVTDRANRTEAASRDLPTTLLSDRGVDAEAIESVRTEARGLSGPEVSAIARTIAGSDAGVGLAGRANATPDADRDDAEGGSVGITLSPSGTPDRGSQTPPVTGPGSGDDRGRDRPTGNASDGEAPEDGTTIPGTEVLDGGEDP